MARWVSDMVRAFQDKGNLLVDGSQSFLSLKIILQVVLLPFFEPLLPPIIVFPNKMRPYLMVHDSFNSVAGVSDGESDDDCARPSNVVHHTGR